MTAPAAPRYYRVQDPDVAGRQTFRVMCDEGWRQAIVATGLSEETATHVLDVIEEQTFRAEIRALPPESPNFYSPGRITGLLWRYNDLVRLTGSGATDDSNSQHLPRETPEGGFESGAVIQADLDWALSLLEPLVARIVTSYYIQGYPAVSIAKHIPGLNRWFVDRARHRGVRAMAESLHWKPREKPIVDGPPQPQDMERECQTTAELRERTIQIVARGLHVCPRAGPPGYACPVISCRGWFDHDSGLHDGAPRIERKAA
jgi:hypothetical protein